MNLIRKHFRIQFPIINYTVLYAEMTSGQKTKTYTFGDKILTEIVTTSEYLAALTYAIILDAQTNQNKPKHN